MTRTQYLKLIEKELHEINKRIDYKIMNGEEYSREARDHKLLLRKIRQNTQRSLFSKFFPSVFQY